jgi:hypothetical protein
MRDCPGANQGPGSQFANVGAFGPTNPAAREAAWLASHAVGAGDVARGAPAAQLWRGDACGDWPQLQCERLDDCEARVIAEIFSLKAISAAITSFWARSALFLWCLVTSCLVVFIALAAGAHWQVGDAPALLAEYCTKLGLAFLVLLVFAAFKTYSERPEPILSLLPQEGQSFCGHRRTAGFGELDGRSDYVVSD